MSSVATVHALWGIIMQGTWTKKSIDIIWPPFLVFGACLNCLQARKKKKKWCKATPNPTYRIDCQKLPLLLSNSCPMDRPPARSPYFHCYLLQTPDKPRQSPTPPHPHITDTICIHLQTYAPAKRQKSSLADGPRDKLSLLWVLNLDRLYRKLQWSEATSLKTWDWN